MSLLHEAVDHKKFDSRVAQRNIERGVLSPEELEKFMKALPDDSENATFVSIDSLMDEEQSGS